MPATLLDAPVPPVQGHASRTHLDDVRHLELRQFSVDEFERMSRLGIFGADERVELLDGYLVNIMPPDPPHSTAVYKFCKRIERALSDGWIVRSENPVRLDTSSPMPDCVIARGTEDDYGVRHPGADDIALIAEIADSSLAIDRKAKARIYARNGIAEYWIANLDEEQIEVYTEPQPQAEPPHYLKRVVYKFGDKVPFRLDGKLLTEVAVEEVFPRPSPADGGE